MAINPRELRRRPEAYENSLHSPKKDEIRGAIRGIIQHLLANPDPSLHHLFTINGHDDKAGVIDGNGIYLGKADKWEVQSEALAAMREFGFDRRKHNNPELEDHYGAKREKVIYRSNNPNLLFVRVRDQSYDRKHTYNAAWYVLYSPQN